MKGLVEYEVSEESDNASDNENGGERNEISTILKFLPPTTNDEPNINRNIVEDDTLEEIVKPKEWEIKLAKKVEKKRKKKELKKLKKLEKKKNVIASDPCSSEDKISEGTPRKRAKIDAFGALSALHYESDEDDDKNVIMANSTSKVGSGLLSLLPEPSTATKFGKKANIFLPNTVRVKSSTESKQKHGSAEVSGNSCKDDVSDGSDDEITNDYFGLNSKSEEKIEIAPEPYGPSKDQIIGENKMQMQNKPQVSQISDDHAMEIIYQNDAIHMDGRLNVADAVSNIIDVNVDQALGPNIRANLLKNLHNKSLAEAAIAHLSTVPKAKGPNDVIARRKHQITYLANVAVAREELLAEQWSQNRHNKRMSSQKYGF